MTVIYVVILTYTRPLEEIDAQLPAHSEWLRKGYDDGVFLASGRRVPRTGGIILAKADSLESLECRMKEDPFYRSGLTKFDIYPFEPSKSVEAISSLLA